MIAKTLLLLITDFILDIITWGVCGYLILRTLKFRGKFLYIGLTIIYLLYMTWHYYGVKYMSELDISIGNQEVLKLIDYDVQGFFVVTVNDFILGAIQILIGYTLGRYVYDRIKSS